MHDEPFWHYRARVEEVRTGSTFEIVVDQGFGDTERTVVHLLGVETADAQSTEVDYDSDHESWVREWIDEAEERHPDWPLEVVTFQVGPDHERAPYLALVYRQLDFEALQTALIREFGDEVAFPTPGCPHRPAVELDGPRCQYCGMKMDA